MAEYFGAKVEDVFNTMPDRFIPSGVSGVDVTIGYDIQGDGGGKWVVTIKNQELKVETVDELPKCSVTMTASCEAFVGGALGKIDAAEAMSSGKLKITGDLTVLGNVLPKAFTKFVIVVRASSIIDSIPARFRADKTEGVDMKIGYKLSGDDGGEWTIVIKDQTCEVKTGADADCTVTLSMSTDTYVGLSLGKIDAGEAFSGGKVKIDGDMAAAGATGKFFTPFEVPGDDSQGEELICLKCLPAIDQRFSTGVHMGKWYAGLKEKKFFASICPECGRTQIPTREVCPKCTVRCTEFREVGPKATVILIDKAYYASPDPLTGKIRKTPYATLFMVMDGSTPDESFNADLADKDFERIEPGMRVRPVWNDVRTGSFRDLLYFEIDD